MSKIIYEPFKTLEEQKAFEKILEQDAEKNLNPIYEEGNEEDIRMAEKCEELNERIRGRLEERLTRLSK
ncbi:hypothetical protein [Clostridium thailandense]|uniref:hypothetical protein n=1 Tax=Clostridium thailandense TaxID=2794346 RepID=UPI003989B9CF